MTSRETQTGGAERSRQAILEAARTEFAAHGYAGTRLSAIAARAGVTQQLVSYHFADKEELYRAVTAVRGEQVREVMAAEDSLPERMRAYALEILRDPEGIRLLAWGGLEYAGRQTDPDHEARSALIRRSVADVARLQDEGRLPAGLDPACLTVMLMAAAMAIPCLPQVVEGACGVDPYLPEFVAHYADQLAAFARLLGA